MEKSFFVVVMPPREDHGVRVGVQLGNEIAEYGTDLANNPALGRWETLCGNVFLSIIDGPDPEIHLGPEVGNGLPDVSTPDDEQSDPLEGG